VPYREEKGSIMGSIRSASQICFIFLLIASASFGGVIDDLESQIIPGGGEEPKPKANYTSTPSPFPPNRPGPSNVGNGSGSGGFPPWIGQGNNNVTVPGNGTLVGINGTAVNGTTRPVSMKTILFNILFDS
jgi:hypothetical protein